MTRRDFDANDLFALLEADIRRSAEHALRVVGFQPGLDMYETDSALVVKLELAGVRPEELNVTLSADDRVLIVAGERLESTSERQQRVRCYHLEIYFGPFERRIVLPPGILIERDAIAASYREGFLTVTLPKKPIAPNQTRSIPIQKG